ncbi:hypothetical protein ABIF78_010155 [Bradyrhizobium japonicum]
MLTDAMPPGIFASAASDCASAALSALSLAIMRASASTFC